MKQFNTAAVPTWCPGCSNYLIAASLRKALDELDLRGEDIVISYDIGCGGNMSNLVDVCAIETLHGRSVPVACGVKAANDALTVIAQAGDGGLLGEGLNHLVHAIQRDDRITVLLINNLVFGLTAGQQSPATPKGELARAAKAANPNSPLAAASVAATCGARFIARVTPDDQRELSEILKKAIKFDGFSLVEVVAPCKIWAKKFAPLKIKKLKSPYKNSKKIIGNDNAYGLLYFEKKAGK
jgi:2-oxoglutarate ferredoxin oxidoreductase subunit beta